MNQLTETELFGELALSVATSTTDELAKIEPPEVRAALALKSTQTEIDLRALAVKNASIVKVVDKAGRDQAHGAAMELKRARVGIQKTGDEAREDAKNYSKAVVAEVKRLVAITEPEETRLVGLRDAWDDEQARIKAEEEAKEKARIAAIQTRIAEIRNFPTLAALCRTASSIEELLVKLRHVEGGFEEFAEEASAVHAAAVSGVEFMLAEKQKEEAERARIKAEQDAAQAALLKAKAEQEAEMARIKVEQEAARAALKQTQDKARAEQAAAASKLADERAAMEKERAQIKAKQDAEQAAAAVKIAAERAALDKERAELFAAQEAAQRAIEDAKPKATRQEEPAQVSAPAIVGNPVDPLPTPTPTEVMRMRPSDTEIAGVLADHYCINVSEAVNWLLDMDLDALAQACGSD